MRLHQAVVCVGWRSPSEQEAPPDSEVPLGSGLTGRSVRTQMERSGRSLKEDNRSQ